MQVWSDYRYLVSYERYKIIFAHFFGHVSSVTDWILGMKILNVIMIFVANVICRFYESCNCLSICHSRWISDLIFWVVKSTCHWYVSSRASISMNFSFQKYKMALISKIRCQCIENFWNRPKIRCRRSKMTAWK